MRDGKGLPVLAGVVLSVFAGGAGLIVASLIEHKLVLQLWGMLLLIVGFAVESVVAYRRLFTVSREHAQMRSCLEGAAMALREAGGMDPQTPWRRVISAALIGVRLARFEMGPAWADVVGMVGGDGKTERRLDA